MKWIDKGKQFKEVADHFSKRKNICLYGDAPSREFFICNICHPFLKKAIDCFVDPSGSIYENDLLGYPVYDESFLFDRHNEGHLIVVTQMDESSSSMTDRLNRAGYVRGWDYYTYNDSIWGEIRGLNHPFVPVFSLYAMDLVYSTSGCIVPDTKCNLNCKDCLNFTPYIKKHITRSLVDVCEDVELYFKWVDFSERYQVSGGEPLMYEHYKELISYIGEKYRSKIGIYETVFNGTIVPSDEICSLIRKYNMTVYLDNYTGSINTNLNKRETIINKFEDFDIRWIDNTVNNWFSLDIEGTDNSSMNDEQITSYFDKCNNPWHAFENGKLYSCNFARFASKAGIYEENENDYFDFRTLTKDRRTELVEFMLGYTTKGYVDFCKKCAGWGASNKKIVPVAVQSNKNKGGQ